MLKYWRVWVLVIVVIASVLAIGFKQYPYGRQGVEVTYVSENSSAYGIMGQGMIITEVNGEPVADRTSWLQLTKNLKGKATIKVNGENKEFEVNDSLGIDVLDIQKTNLDFGLDLRGGTRVILRLEGNVTPDIVEQVKGTLQTRANLFGLREIKFKTISDISGSGLIQVEATGIGSEVVNGLLAKTGNFEAKVTKPVEMASGSGLFDLGAEKFDVKELGNDTVSIGDREIKLGEPFDVSGINFEYTNKTEGLLLFTADVYGGKDIELVFTDAQRSGIRSFGAGGYSFFFGISVSTAGAERFAKVTSGIPSYIDPESGESYLFGSEILLYLDDQLVSNLRISSGLGGTVNTQSQITGGRPTRQEVLDEKLRLQTILRSGATPAKIIVDSIDIISPTLGSSFLNSVIIVAGLAGLSVFVIVLIRYRRLKIALPLLFIALSEVVLILGIAALNDSLIWGLVLLINLVVFLAAWWRKHEVDMFAFIGIVSVPMLGATMSWTIDLPTIGGLIAVMGTGIDHQIIIADEAIAGIKKRILQGMKDKIKVAFFIIFGAAATTIFAMIPLIFLVAEFVRGFALTAIIGVWVGITITRPAYAKVVESMKIKFKQE